MTTDEIRSKCWDQALYAYGTAWIFEQRSQRLRRKLGFLTFLGIAVPVTVGGVVVTFGANPRYFLVLAGLLSLVQLIGSVWSLVARWDDAIAYALSSMTANYRFSSKYERLAREARSDIAVEFNLLEADYQARRDQDFQQGLTDKDKRAGLRAGLRQFQRECAACRKVPTSMKPTKCGVCGNF